MYIYIYIYTLSLYTYIYIYIYIHYKKHAVQQTNTKRCLSAGRALQDALRARGREPPALPGLSVCPSLSLSLSISLSLYIYI